MQMQEVSTVISIVSPLTLMGHNMVFIRYIISLYQLYTPDTPADLILECNANFKDPLGPGC